ncbi:MAG: RNA polymerase sigma factor [Pirellulales bacterium]
MSTRSRSPERDSIEKPRPVEMATPSGPTRLAPAAVSRLYDDYAGELRGFLLGVLANGHAAEEALQNTFVKAVESGHTARDDAMKGWLFRVAYNEAITLRRRAHVRNKAAAHLGEQAVAAGDDATVPPPDETILRSEDSARVRAALQTLPEELRRIVTLRIAEDRTFAEIAAELKLPLGTIYARLQVAFKRLRGELSDPPGS